MRASSADPAADVFALATLEGTSIRFRLASLSERATAFMIDFGLTQIATLILVPLLLIVVHSSAPHIGQALGMVVSFFFRNVYFAACELRWSGQTIGKRKLGIRAIARDGGPLTGQAILARNATREIEFFAPIFAVSNPRALLDIDTRLGLPIAAAWLAVFVLMPWLNRERLRCGDLLGGTVVVAVPQPVLLQDLASGATPTASRYVFTAAQLGIYGITELQVLEQVLRRAEEGSLLTRDVAKKIRRKIGWRGAGHVDDASFLQAFYQAQRAYLERKLLFGVRKERKSG